MSRKVRQRCSPMLLAAIFLTGAMAEGVRLNQLHTRVATALQDAAPLEAVHFISASSRDASPGKSGKAKCTRQIEA